MSVMWGVFKPCNHEEEKISLHGTHEVSVKLNHTWKPGSWIKPHLDSDQRLYVMSEMFFVKDEKHGRSLHKYKIKRIRSVCVYVCVCSCMCVSGHVFAKDTSEQYLNKLLSF